jgi:signal transduction histidine kinase/CheY-like chemotaxis protein
LQRSLVRSASAIALLSLTVFSSSVYFLLYRPMVLELASAQLNVTSEQVTSRLRTLVARAEAVAHLNHDWGSRGLIDIEHPQRYNDLLRAQIEHGPQLSSMVAAHESGRELLLLRMPDGRWLNRYTNPADGSKQAHFLTWSADGKLEKDEWRESDYDARTRPWFKGGMAESADDAIYWTPPYVFRSTQEPGMSAVVHWSGPDGGRYAMTSDIRLADLSRFTRELVVGKTGFAVVFTDDGRLVGLPRDERLETDEAIRVNVLKPAGEIGVAPLRAALDMWHQAGSPESRLIRFDGGGATWVATFLRTRFGAQTFWVGTMAREAEFLPTTLTHLGVVGILVGATLLLAAVVATSLARRLAQPLRLMGEQSARIGRLELDQPEAVYAPWRELDDLIHAQEAMRIGLLSSTQRLEQANELLEAKVTERTRELISAKEAADAAGRAKAEFLANMSHEIRTPLNAIVGLKYLLRHEGVTPEQSVHLDRIDSASLHLLSIVNNILDLSKIEAGGVQLENTNFHLSTILDNVHSIIAQGARDKGLTVEVDGDAVPLWLRGDPTRLRQALLNFAGNAVKFTEKGSIALRAQLLQESGDELLVRFSVQDTGVGVAAEQIPRLFRAFEQADPSITRRFGGTGLGLAITERLAHLMGGECGVESRLGVGSTFWFTAKLHRGHGAKLESKAGSTANAEAQLRLRHPGARILLVEDNEVNRHVAVAMLHGVGLKVDTAVDGFEAVNMAAAGTYDLVLMDMQMPRMGGLEATRAIRLLQGWAGRPIIALTANAFDEDRHASEAAGMNDFISKPMDVNTFYACLLRWLDAAAAKPA